MSEVVDDCATCAYNVFRYEESRLQELITADADPGRIAIQTEVVDQARTRWLELRPKADWERRVLAGLAHPGLQLPNLARSNPQPLPPRHRRLSQGQVAVLCVLAVIIAAIAGAVVGAMTV